MLNESHILSQVRTTKYTILNLIFSEENSCLESVFCHRLMLLTNSLVFTLSWLFLDK